MLAALLPALAAATRSPAFNPAAATKDGGAAAADAGVSLTSWLGQVARLEVAPVAVRACPLSPTAPPSPPAPACNATGSWQYSAYGNKTTYEFHEDAAGDLHVVSTFPPDPWTQASGKVATGVRPRPGPPRRCLGGIVPLPPPLDGPDLTISFNCTKGAPTVITKTGTFSPDCSRIVMDDGAFYTRVSHGDAEGASAAAAPPDLCMDAPLKPSADPGASWEPVAGKPGWQALRVTYHLADPNATSGAAVVEVDVRIEADATNSTVRVGSTLTALADLDFCLGGVSILALDVADPQPSAGRKGAGKPPPVLHASSGGPAGADHAFQPWVCPLALGGAPCDATQGTPYYAHEDPSRRILSADSGCDGRSSNFQLPIHSIEFGGDNASTSRGLWAAPEYSGMWRLDAYASEAAGGAPRLYWSLPTLLFAMSQAETVPLPFAAFGVWSSVGGATDWANAVRRAIATGFTPPFAGSPPAQLAVYQGLGALPSYQTEDQLYITAAKAQQLALEAFVFDAGTYTTCEPSSVCNGSAVAAGKCCAPQGDWWTDQGDYMPTPSRFPEHGFMALERNITAAIPNYGIWITPQAAPWSSKTYAAHPELYLEQGGSSGSHAPGASSALLNLALPEAQDLFYSQFETMITVFNATRIWFDYNTASRQTHWNPNEQMDRQGLLELGFYRGLYNVFDRTLAAHPNVWIEGCASGGRMMDLGSLSRVHSFWTNDDSVSDDRSRRLRLGANHFLPAHYLQNAYLPVGCGAAPPGGAPLSLDAERLLTYFNGVLQIGQGLSYWDDKTVADAADAVALFKAKRALMDPLKTSYYRLWESPSPTPAVPGFDATATVGWIYEDPAARAGLVYVARQSKSPSPNASIALSRPSWPWSAPAPALVRFHGAPNHVPKFSLLAGGNGGEVTFAVAADGGSLDLRIPTAGTQTLLGYTF